MNRRREEDRELAARAGAGDERAFATLVERHRGPLLRYVTRRFGAEEAEDAVQEALLSAHRALLAGTEPADVRAWLSTIAWRRALDMSRRERAALPLDVAVAGRAADEPEARAIQANELGRVVAAMSDLPARQRTALALSALEGRSLEEIGDALDVAPDTAKSLVARSRRTLTHRLAAAELGCDSVRVRMEDSAARGVRLSGDVTLHLRACKSCARAHRDIRRRRRVALVIPFGLLIRTAGVRDKLRDLIAFNPAWEAHIGAAKMCTAACLTLGAGAAATPAVVPTVIVDQPKATATATPTPAKKPRKKPRRERPAPTAVPTAAPTIVARVTPAPTPKPKATATPRRKDAHKRRYSKPPVAIAGTGESAPQPYVVKPKQSPTPVATPPATATPPPVATPAATPPPPAPTPSPEVTPAPTVGG